MRVCKQGFAGYNEGSKFESLCKGRIAFVLVRIRLSVVGVTQIIVNLDMVGSVRVIEIEENIDRLLSTANGHVLAV
jgi:hypothetical protein